MHIAGRALVGVGLAASGFMLGSLAGRGASEVTDEQPEMRQLGLLIGIPTTLIGVGGVAALAYTGTGWGRAGAAVLGASLLGTGAWAFVHSQSRD